MLKTVFMPGVVEIGDWAFKSCSSLTNMTFSEDLSSIGKNAFYNCTSLEHFIVPEKITQLSDRTFHSCVSLKSVTLPEGLESIGSACFAYCSSLESIVIPDNVSVIKSNAFQKCTGLKEVVLPKELTEIGEVVFANTGLEKIIIPEKVTKIGYQSFIACYSLKEVYIPAAVSSIAGNAFDYCNSLESVYVIKDSYPDQFCKGTANLADKIKYVYIEEDHIIYETVSREPSCLEEGIKTIRTIDSDEITVRDVVIPALGHDYSETAFEATCTESGYVLHTCERCGDSYTTDETPPKGHTFGDWIIDKDPSCTESGIEHRECAVCGEIENTVTEATGHRFSVAITKATLKVNGKIESVCTVCGEKDPDTTEVIYYPKTIKLTQSIYTYTNKTIKPTYVVKDAQGNEIAESNYTITGAKEIGKHTTKITFKGNYYTGTKSLTFTIKSPKVTGLKVTSPKTNQLKVAYTKALGGVSYQIWYRVKGTSTWKKTTATGTSKLLKSLKGGKTYQVKVRAYKKVSGTTYYGAWSGVKTIKVKK